jgi:hypothetical protein
LTVSGNILVTNAKEKASKEEELDCRMRLANATNEPPHLNDFTAPLNCMLTTKIYVYFECFG